MELCDKCSGVLDSFKIQCYYCKFWYHAACLDIKAEYLESWSPSYMRFACRGCAFSEDKYDASAALVRLQIEKLNKRRNGLQNQARSELNLLTTYGIKVPIRPHLLGNPAELDLVAIQILSLLQPTLNEAYVPLRTVGDGNCFYRAVSRSLCSSEEHHVLLRLLTAIELILHRDVYDTKKKYNDFLNDLRIVTSKYEKLVYDAMVESSYAEMAHIYALSAALSEPIHSIFPHNKKNELSEAFTRVVTGRGVGNVEPKIHIMWSSATVPLKSEAFHANHFVTLIKKTIEKDLPTCNEPFHSGFRISDSLSESDTDDVTDVSTLTDVINELENTADCDLQTNLTDTSTMTDVRDETNTSTLTDVINKLENTADCDMQTNLTDTSTMTDVRDETNTSTLTDVINELENTADCDMQTNLTDTSTMTDVRNETNTSTLSDVINEIESTADSDLQTNMTDNNDDNTELSDVTMGTLPNGFLNVDQCVNLLQKNITGKKIIPGGLKENVYFILDNTQNVENKLQKKRSNFSDDCGVWDTGKGTSPKNFFVKRGDGTLKQIYVREGQYCVKKQVKKKIEYVVLHPQPENKDVFVVQRYYATLKSDCTYKKRVTWLEGAEQKLAICEYVGKFKGLVPHGNSTVQTEYLRTPHYVINDIKEMTGKKKPHQIYNELTDKYDELTQPTGLRQIHDVQHRERQKQKIVDGHTDNFADQIRHLETLVADNDKFVRSVIHNNGKTPCVILYTDEQLQDLKKICCNGQSVLGVDKTFNLCKMHVTVTCYKQTTVHRQSTGQHPIFLGPIYIHDNSDFETYSNFFHHLKIKLMDCPLKNLTIGSDDEKALVKAITAIIPEASHILCTRHLEENARQILKDDAVTLQQRNDILKKIFGNDGLVDLDDSICFDDRCEAIEEGLTEVSTKFHSYFTKRLKGCLKEKVSKPARDGKVNKNWTNNNCESINHILKQTVDWKSRPLTEFVEKVQDLVRGQFKGLRSALVGVGEYRLTDNYRHFYKSKTEWTGMTEQQRLNHYKKYRQYFDRENRLVTSSDGKTTLLEPRTNGRKPGQRKRKVNVRTVTVTDKRPKR